MRPPSGPAWSTITLALTLAAMPAVAATPTFSAPGTPAGAIAGPTALFTSDDMLIFAVDAGGQPLSDGFAAYSSRAGLFIPLGDLARLLDLAITVDPAARRAEGWLISPSRTAASHLAAGGVGLRGKQVPLP